MANEINRILKLFADLQHGECWIGVNFKDALHDVTTNKALENRSGKTNSIWQLVSHIIYWRTTVVNRINVAWTHRLFLISCCLKLEMMNIGDKPCTTSKPLIIRCAMLFIILRTIIWIILHPGLHKPITSS